MPDLLKPTERHVSRANWSSPIMRFATCALLPMMSCGLGWCDSASAQASPEQSLSAITTSRPLDLRAGSSVPRMGIPLGSVEITTPGISPITPLSNAPTRSTSDCSDAGARSSPLFDGGGFSVGRSMTCGPRAPSSVPGQVGTGVKRAGIPLGSTELGDPGLSSAPATTAPSLSTVSPALSSGATPCSNDQGSLTISPSGC